eukprot:1180321-Prorocentrum_minimum.AAC.4
MDTKGNDVDTKGNDVDTCSRSSRSRSSFITAAARRRNSAAAASSASGSRPSCKGPVTVAGAVFSHSRSRSRSHSHSPVTVQTHVTVRGGVAAFLHGPVAVTVFSHSLSPVTVTVCVGVAALLRGPVAVQSQSSKVGQYVGWKRNTRIIRHIVRLYYVFYDVSYVAFYTTYLYRPTLQSSHSPVTVRSQSALGSWPSSLSPVAVQSHANHQTHRAQALAVACQLPVGRGQLLAGRVRVVLPREANKLRVIHPRHVVRRPQHLVHL